MPKLEDAIASILVNDRVCPVPTRWNELFNLLCRVAEDKGVDPPLMPLILGAWWFSSPVDKQDRLKSQLTWASDHGALEQAMKYLARLSENDWVHLADAPSGKGDYSYLQESD